MKLKLKTQPDNAMLGDMKNGTKLFVDDVKYMKSSISTSKTCSCVRLSDGLVKDFYRTNYFYVDWDKTKIPFKDLPCGDIFIWNGDVLIKGCTKKNLNENVLICINIENGNCSYFRENDEREVEIIDVSDIQIG